MAVLTFVRTQTIWHRETDFKTISRTVEPLVLDRIGSVWVSTGQRGADGRLLYRQVVCCKDRT